VKTKITVYRGPLSLPPPHRVLSWHKACSWKVHDLTVARTGRVKADIHAENILIHGTVEGRIHASGKVTLHSDGNMSGDITSGRISIAEGAVFKGSLKIQPSR
jgi:cytoskeletal protein CcmA (bactofilin family)